MVRKVAKCTAVYSTTPPVPQARATSTQQRYLCNVSSPFFISMFLARWAGVCAPAPLPGSNCVLDRLQSLVSGPETSPRIKDEADNLIFISLLRAASTLGASGGSSRLLPWTCVLRIFGRLMVADEDVDLREVGASS